MKWIFYVVVFIYMFYRAVYGLRTKEIGGVSIEPVKYEGDTNFLHPGARKTLICKGTSKTQKLEWVDPRGNVVKRLPANRVSVQDTSFPLTARSRVPGLLLVFTSVTLEDRGVWECRTGRSKQNTSLCVIQPSEFVNTPTVVTVDSGRSITLSCQAIGDPEPRVLWYRNGEIITDDMKSSKYQVMTKYNSEGSEGLLTITSLGAEDSGPYVCEAIQETHPFNHDCAHVQTLNISVQVNHAPAFKGANETVYVYGSEEESIELVCSASGFPIPTYKWLKDTDGIQSEFPQDKIQLLNNGTEALLVLEPNSYKWNEKYRCQATNKYGDADKHFLLRKTVKPTKPNHVEPQSEFADKIELKLTWNDEMNFPIEHIEVQYLKKKWLQGRNLISKDWLRSKLKELELDNADFEDISVTLPDLDENTEYYVHLRAVNSEGKSQWSEPIVVSTVEKSEEPEEPEEPTEESVTAQISDSAESEIAEVPDSAAPATSQVSDSAFYGIFFAGGIAVIVIASMFLMRMV